MSKGSCGFCPPNLDSFPERDRKALGGMVVAKAPLQGTALRRRTGAVKKPIMLCKEASHGKRLPCLRAEGRPAQLGTVGRKPLFALGRTVGFQALF